MRRNAAISFSPYRFAVPSVRVSYSWMAAMLGVQIAILAFLRDFSALKVIFASGAGGFSVSLTSFFRQKSVKASDVLFHSVEGVMAGFFIPETCPAVAVFFISMLSAQMFSRIFGPISSAWANSVALFVIVVSLIFPSHFNFPLADRSIFSSAEPLMQMVFDGKMRILKIEEGIPAGLFNWLDERLGVSIPSGYLTLFIDNQAPIPAFRFNAATTLSAIAFFAFGIQSPLIPILFLASDCFFSPIFSNGAGNPIITLWTGGTLFVATFFIQKHGTIPQTFAGKVIFAVSLGFFASLSNGGMPGSVGICYAVLLSNVLSLFVAFFEEKLCRRIENRRLKKIGRRSGQK